MPAVHRGVGAMAEVAEVGHTTLHRRFVPRLRPGGQLPQGDVPEFLDGIRAERLVQPGRTVRCAQLGL